MPYPHHLHPADGHVRHCITVPPPRRPGFQLIEIILLKDEIYHDIDAETHQLQQVRKAVAKNDADVIEFATDDMSRYLMDRYIDRYVSQAVTRLSAYLAIPSPFVHRIANNHTKDWQEKSILIALPHRWPPHLIEPLRDAVHQLIVKGTEKELLATSLGSNDAYVLMCEAAALDADADITMNINTRYGPMSAPMTPFG